MPDQSVEPTRTRVKSLQARGVEIASPASLTLGNDVKLENIETGVRIGPGTVILGSGTMIGAGTEILGAARIRNCMIGRRCTLHAGEYLDSVLLDGCSTVGWARIRGHSAWEEGTQAAHNVDTKTTILGYKTTLGSLINFCNVLMLGGTSPRLEVGAEVGSGTINFNFLPYGPTIGALIKPCTVVGSIDSPFLCCADAPVRYDFIGGHSSIIAPVVIGLNCVVAAKSRVNPGIYGDDVMISGGNLERTTVVDVAKVRVLKDVRPKYRILVHQLATAAAFKTWWNFREEWAETNGVDSFERKLLSGFGQKVDLFFSALESYGDSTARYLLANDGHSRPEHLERNRETALLWSNRLKFEIRHSLDDRSRYTEATRELLVALRGGTGQTNSLYEALGQVNYFSPEVVKAHAYFSGVAEGIIGLWHAAI